MFDDRKRWKRCMIAKVSNFLEICPRKLDFYGKYDVSMTGEMILKQRCQNFISGIVFFIHHVS